MWPLRVGSGQKQVHAGEAVLAAHAHMASLAARTPFGVAIPGTEAQLISPFPKVWPGFEGKFEINEQKLKHF